MVVGAGARVVVGVGGLVVGVVGLVVGVVGLVVGVVGLVVGEALTLAVEGFLGAGVELVVAGGAAPLPAELVGGDEFGVEEDVAPPGPAVTLGNVNAAGTVWNRRTPAKPTNVPAMTNGALFTSCPSSLERKLFYMNLVWIDP